MSGASHNPIDPWRACRRGLSFSGAATLSDMPRLASAVLGLGPERAGQEEPGQKEPVLNLSTDEGAAFYELRFDRDLRGRAIVAGRVRANLRLQCQRCLDEVAIPTDVPIELALIARDEDAADLPDHLDPLLVTEEGLIPLEIVEDELLLAIPAVPRHARDCGASHTDNAPKPSIADAEAKQDERRRPFAVLAGLKSRSDT
jgi:uncharacterized protein